jgi:hypothetical protein
MGLRGTVLFRRFPHLWTTGLSGGFKMKKIVATAGFIVPLLILALVAAAVAKK